MERVCGEMELCEMAQPNNGISRQHTTNDNLRYLCQYEGNMLSRLKHAADVTITLCRTQFNKVWPTVMRAKNSPIIIAHQCPRASPKESSNWAAIIESFRQFHQPVFHYHLSCSLARAGCFVSHFGFRSVIYARQDHPQYSAFVGPCSLSRKRGAR